MDEALPAHGLLKALSHPLGVILEVTPIALEYLRCSLESDRWIDLNSRNDIETRDVSTCFTP
jgi:hypothetical protein